MDGPPWDQRIARVFVKPLVRSPVTPNQVTAATRLIALAGAGLFVPGDADLTIVTPRPPGRSLPPLERESQRC